MTTVAWNGRFLAVDKQMTSNDALIETGTKAMCLYGNAVLAWTGLHECGLLLADWFRHGAKADTWPAFQGADDWTRLIVAYKAGVCEVYERHPIAQVVEDPFMAWGSGAMYALGAMHAGADPKSAVLAATRFDPRTGCGVDVFDLAAL